MATYKTPDVYVEEISIFPPSVAEVETAIPAFIGYTQKATKISDKDLFMTPYRVKSMLDFERYYGYAPNPTVDKVYVDDSGNFMSAEVTTNYFLYDSVRLFYDNGGGDCYIVSVGDYETTVAIGNETTGLKGGLKALEKFDEPTILLAPDSVKLSVADLHGKLQTAMLEQCAILKDRVAVLDLKKLDEVKKTGYFDTDPIGNFRNNIGINNLKYGAAYTPWLKVTMDKNITYRQVKTQIFKYGSAGDTPLSLALFTSNSEVQKLVANYNSLLADLETIGAGMDSAFGNGKTLREKFNALINDFSTNNNDNPHVNSIFTMLYTVADKLDNWANTLTNSSLKSTIATYINSDFRTIIGNVIALEVEAVASGSGITSYATVFDDFEGLITHENWKVGANSIFKAGTISASTAITDADLDPAKRLSVVNALKAIFEELNDKFLDVTTASTTLESTYESSLISSFPLYKNIIEQLDSNATTMPPSGAIVGQYAATDRERGVWKAPANVSLNAVIGPDVIYSASELDALNIDVNGGKSVNAIRAFSGRGTLIWGARTLAGNDNEWRYVPVRRFYNMVEESIKKSTYWAVFEPNNANTWVKIKGMIENYLTNKWKDGALAGAKPDEAFFVKVGLGTTMSSQDILEGRMNVEIGMAVVRPAEFIVLKFSHKLQQS
jgi:phage tail sheath protein FI